LSADAISIASFESEITRLPTRIEGNHIRHITSKVEGSYHFSAGFVLNGGLQLESIRTDLTRISHKFFIG